MTDETSESKETPQEESKPEPVRRTTPRAKKTLQPPAGATRPFGITVRRSGNKYRVTPGEPVEVKPEDVPYLLSLGFRG